ncbi:MAG: cation:proton antiporter [Deltaproteobacteria bacterium]|nr:cation:proton antiporter [Deltaproteobacteria bacterium]
MPARPSRRSLVLPGLLAGALLVLVLVLAGASAWASGPPGSSSGTSHEDPVAPVLLALTVVLVAAKLGGDLATRVRQPSVLGELVVGVLLGNLSLAGLGQLDYLKHDQAVDLLSRLGVIILLFEVGLESTVSQMLKVGGSALLVAVLGVITPFGLGWVASGWLLPASSVYVHAFIGAALTATSVGITARVLKDLDRGQTKEARIILGAAVIDDVLGLLVLAVVTAIIAAADHGDAVRLGQIAWVVGKAGAFLVGSLFLGVLLSPRLFWVASKLQARGVLLALGLSFCFLLSWLAGAIGLAPIVGAFAAGLILEETHYRDFVTRGEHGLEELVQPIASFLVPVFFVLMGMRTDLRAFVQPGVASLAAAITAVAILGKQACALGALGRGVDRLSVGVGMIPRGEVGLIFANIGAALTVKGERVVSPGVYSAVVVMVIVTTMITPPALKWSLNRRSRSTGNPGPS